MDERFEENPTVRIEKHRNLEGQNEFTCSKKILETSWKNFIMLGILVCK